ncbi:TIR domain-containing protein [Saccharothrix xinjiangensis]|uniref:TIR domain-containing protein n=1 Tax=Saccharothrix xinjiangensis TaxID=204798 RepID=A0ABV9Y1G2_9PSEU
MSLDPATTLRGALRVLGEGDPTWLAQVDDLLGGVLTTGYGGRRALWAWLEPDSALPALVDSALTAEPARRAAAHTLLLCSAFFARLRSELGRAPVAEDEVFTSYLYAVEIPTRSAMSGPHATNWIKKQGALVHRHLPTRGPLLPETFADDVVARYREAWLDLVGTAYVRPRFRTASATPGARLTDERWWSAETVVDDDVDLFIARHFEGITSLTRPLLVVGGPGMGKTSLLHHLAATLPTAELVVPSVVTLFRGLLPEPAEGSPRVLLLDGLEAVLPERADYLLDVLVFQQREFQSGRPVAVVVTAPLSALDRVDLPDGTPVIKVEPFDDERVRAWVEAWNEATAGTGRRPVDPADALTRGELAREPLSLRLITEHHTAPGTSVLDGDLTRAGLVRQAIGRGWRHAVAADYLAAEDLVERCDDVAGLSRRSLAVRPLVFEFVAQLVAEKPESGRRRFLAELDEGLRGPFREVAAYSANLVLAKLHAAGPGATHGPAAVLVPRWKAGLSADDHRATMSLLVLNGDVLSLRVDPPTPPAHHLVEFAHRDLVAGSGPVGQVTWSADGSFLTANCDGRPVLWRIGAGEGPESTHAEPQGTTDVAWHPTTARVAVVRRNRHGGEVVLVDLPGGTSRSLCEVTRGSRVAWAPDGREIAVLDDSELRLVNAVTGRAHRSVSLHRFLPERGSYLLRPRWTAEGRFIVISNGQVVHLLDARSLEPRWRSRVGGEVMDLIARDENDVVAAGSSPDGNGVQLHQVSTDAVLAVLEGHTRKVLCVRFSPDGQYLASASADNTVRIWRRRDLTCVAVLPREHVGRRGGLAFHPTEPLLAVKDGNRVDVVRLRTDLLGRAAAAESARRYANAKVVLVGDTGVGKSGLGLVLSGQPYEPTSSTHGRRVWTFERTHSHTPEGEAHTREILLWDLAGQPGYRMVHQLHLNEVAVALVVFDARGETDPFAGVRHWQRALEQARRLDGATAARPRTYLVAARVDRGGIAVGRRRIDEVVASLGFDGYLETSAKEGWGVEELARAIRDGVDWEAVPVVGSSALFEAIREFVLEEKRQGRVLSAVDDLWHGFRRVWGGAPEASADHFSTCLGRLESVGLVRRMAFGDHVLLQPELLDAYASALVQAAREEPDGLGSVPEADALEGRFRMPDDERLGNRQRERVLLVTVVQELLRREIALKEVTDRQVDLIFPSQFTRQRPDAPRVPGEDVVFAFSGRLHSVYATLAVRLSHSRLFRRDGMWHDTATFAALAGGTCGIALRETGEGRGELVVFHEGPVEPVVRAQFETYVVEHLAARAVEGTVEARRVRVCGVCGYAIPDDVVRGRLARGATTARCPMCDEGVVGLVDERVGDVRSAVVEMNASADEQRDRDVAATALKGKREAGDYDVFLCHNTRDKPRAVELAARLEARGILPWLDVRDIRPGSRWQQAMARGIAVSRSAAVLVGPAGRGPWHDAEMELIRDRFVRSGRPVIPVILDGAEGDPELPDFLALWHTVDLRVADPDPIDQLVWGITGEPPR